MYQVVRHDKHCVRVEKFKPGGEQISRGKFAGQIAKDSWELVGYFLNVEQAYQSILIRKIEDKIFDEAKNAIVAINEAKIEILNQIKENTNNASNVS